MLMDSSQPLNERKKNRNEKFIYASLLIVSPLLFVVILIELQIIDLDEMNVPVSLFSNSFLNIILITFILLSVIDIIVTYEFFIPFTMWEEFYGSQTKPLFGKILVVLTCGSSSINVYGLILGLLWWRNYRLIPFYFTIPFIIIGFIHGIYLYHRYIVNYDARKNEFNEKKRRITLPTPMLEPLDPTQDIFTPIVNHLNYNEKIMLRFNPDIKRILISGSSAIIFLIFFSFFITWVLSNTFSSNSIYFNTVIFMSLGMGILSLTLLPVILLVVVIREKNMMHVFTSERIIIKSLRKIKIIGYDEILNVQKIQERMKITTIRINYKKRLEDGSYKEKSIQLTVPIALNLLENLTTLIEKFSKRD